MILLTKIQGDRVVVNANEILRITRVPDTLVELRDGKNIYVRESPGEIIHRTTSFHRACNTPLTKEGVESFDAL